MMKVRLHGQRGFTLLELTISMALLLVLSGAMLGGMAAMQKNFRASEIRNSLNDQLRSSLEQMQQEIGQAGLAPSGMQKNGVYQGDAGAFSMVQTSAAITGSSTAQTVNVTFYSSSSSTTNPLSSWLTYLPTGTPNTAGYPSVIVDSGVNSEVVTITGVASTGTGTGTVTAVFNRSHASGANIYWHGIYQQGVMPPDVNSYSDHSLRLFGDIDGNNSLALVIYRCPISTDSAASGLTTDSNGVKWGPLVRSEYVYSSSTGTFVLKSSTNMLEQVRVATTTYPTAADGCRFDYYDPYSHTYDSMVLSASITLVARSLRNDPTTNQPITVSKSFMNIQPRNILSAYYMYNSSVQVDTSEFLPVPQQLVDFLSALGD